MLKKTTLQMTRIIRRITRNKTGMTEEDTLCLVQASVISRAAYILPYTRLNKQENDQIETILKAAYKTTIGLPQWTTTSKLHKLGINTFEETKEATLVAQKQRLQPTRTGRSILERVGTRAHKTNITRKVYLEKETRRKLLISVIVTKTYRQGSRRTKKQ